MERAPKTVSDVITLLQISELLTSSIRTVLSEWKQDANSTTPTVLPSRALHSAQRTIIAAAGQLISLVSEPSAYITSIACQYWESRALYICASSRIPDLLSSSSLTVAQLSLSTGIESLKLARVLRCLCSIHIFEEVEEGLFCNNSVSSMLVGNEPLRAYVMMFNGDLFTAADRLPKHLEGERGHSYKVDETAFQEAVGTKKSRWEWLKEMKLPDDLQENGIGYPGLMGQKTAGTEPVKRPEHEIFGMAMLGGGLVYGTAHPYDYPWGSLGKATVVDVGGGVGMSSGFDLQLSKIYPELNFIIQDRQPVLEQAKTIVWPRENPSALNEGRVSFMPHDFFRPNPVIDANIYWLRYILHDWSDEYCIRVLSAIRGSMTTSKSRILICELVVNTTLGCVELEPAPAPLPANYGYYTRYSHQRHLAMMGIMNGIERTPAQFRVLEEKSGLKIEKIWECRSLVSMVELSAVLE